MTFIYDELTRHHSLNSKHIPSVSQVIEPLSDFSMISPEVLARKAELGTQFHEAIRLHLLDDLNHDSLDEDLVKPMIAFHNWWKVEGVGIHDADMIIECSNYHQTLKYCGKPDLEISDDSIYDWKLRGFMPAVDRVKLEAYKHMITRKKLSLWTVCFDLEGKMSIHDSNHPHSWGIFRKMLERYYSELEFYKLMGKWKGVN